tara:strand:+ start:1683 stop:4727 length:3045 start_codon:yes stop_codon:yes gene_type:complete
MATIQELQKRLDDKTFDPSKLNDDQRAAVDLAFQSGQLKGYSSVAEVEKERNIGATLVAKEKEKKADPFKTATEGIFPFTGEGVERSDLELAGDVIGSGAVYIKDMPKIVSAFARDPSAGYGADKLRAAATNFDKLEKMFQRLPVIRNVKILSKTARAFGKFFDGFRTVGAAPTQLITTEVKAQLAGSVGAGAGSVLYDMANVATDFETAANNDLGDVSNNDIKKLPYAQQVLVHSAEAMRNALFFNLAGSSLGPILAHTLRGMKGIVGLGKESKELTEAAAKRNIQLSASTVAQTEKFGGKIVQGFEKTFGVFPFANIFAKKQRAAVEKQLFSRFLDEVITKAPLEQVGMLQYQFLPAMQRNFLDFNKTIQTQFKTLDNIIDTMNNPRFIPTQSVKKVAEDFMKRMEATLPEGFLGKTVPDSGVPEYTAQRMKDSGFDDTLIDVINKIRTIGDQVTPSEYQGMMRVLTRSLATTKMRDPSQIAFSLRTAFKEDFNKVANPDNIQGYLASSNFKQQYDDILNSTGKEAADEFAQKTIAKMNDFGEQLETANRYFSTIVGKFDTPTAKRIINGSANIFSVKGMLNNLPVKVTGDQMWSRVLHQEFSKGSADGIKELRYLFGTGNPNFKEGVELFNRARSRYLWDAFMKSFEKQPNMVGKTIADRLADAERLGAVQYKGYEEIFDAAGTKSLEQVTRVDPVMAQRYKIGEVDARDLMIKAGEAGNFNIKKFREAMGYTDEASKEASMAKWTEMFGGGTQGKAAANDLRQMIDILDKEYGKLISDSQQFIMRRLILQGGAAGAAGAFIIGSGSIAGAIPFALLLGSGGYLLSSPKALKLMLDVYSDIERFDKLGKVMSPTNMPKSMFRLLNWAAEEDKDFPDVDPKKIDFEEVTDYLINKNIKVPALGFSTDAFPKKIRDELFPEQNVIKNSSQAEDVSGVNFLIGNDRGGQNANAIVNFQPPANTVNTTPAFQGLVDPKFLQTQNIQSIQPIQANQFKALFPNDPLSQAIAERGQQ